MPSSAILSQAMRSPSLAPPRMLGNAMPWLVHTVACVCPRTEAETQRALTDRSSGLCRNSEKRRPLEQKTEATSEFSVFGHSVVFLCCPPPKPPPPPNIPCNISAGISNCICALADGDDNNSANDPTAKVARRRHAQEKELGCRPPRSAGEPGTWRRLRSGCLPMLIVVVEAGAPRTSGKGSAFVPKRPRNPHHNHQMRSTAHKDAKSRLGGTTHTRIPE